MKLQLESKITNLLNSMGLNMLYLKYLYCSTLKSTCQASLKYSPRGGLLTKTPIFHIKYGIKIWI